MSDVASEDGALRWRMRVDEHALLVALLQDLDEALDGPTDDPVVERLFPPAVEGDTDEDDQLRTLIAAELLMRRHEAISALLDVLRRAEPAPDDAASPVPVVAVAGADRAMPRVDVSLVDDEPAMMLSVLNDVRLALASRIGLTAVELPQLLDESDERGHAVLATIDHLAYFQMQLLREIDPVAVAHAEPDDD